MMKKFDLLLFNFHYGKLCLWNTFTKCPIFKPQNKAIIHTSNQSVYNSLKQDLIQHPI